jgi:hypothetical protein
VETPSPSPSQKPNTFFNELLTQWARGESMPKVIEQAVIDVEKKKELEKIASFLDVLLAFKLDERARKSVKIKAEALNHKTLAITITKTGGNFGSMLHGQLYDPLIYTLIDIRGAYVDGKWSIRITAYIVRRVEKKLLLERLTDLLKAIVNLERVYF